MPRGKHFSFPRWPVPSGMEASRRLRPHFGVVPEVADAQWKVSQIGPRGGRCPVGRRLLMLMIVIPNPRGGRNSIPHRFPDNLCVYPSACIFMHSLLCANNNLLVRYRARIYITEHVGAYPLIVCFASYDKTLGWDQECKVFEGRVE